MKQTAVEWYANQLHKVFNNTTDASNLSHEELLKQAKEMEKEQMIDWYATGQADTVHMYEQHLKKPSNTNEK